MLAEVRNSRASSGLPKKIGTGEKKARGRGFLEGLSEETREARKKRSSGVFLFVSVREEFYQVQVWSISSSCFPTILSFHVFFFLFV